MMTTWTSATLSELARIIMGQSPDSMFYNNSGAGMPFLQGCAQFGSHFPETDIYCTAPAKVGPASSILFSVRAPVGEVNRADRDYCIGRGVAAIVPHSADVSYVENYLRFLRPEFDRIAQGSTFGAINSEDFGSVVIRLPTDRTQQATIASVIATLDRGVDQISVLITKYERIRTGLVQSLLTRGIDEHDHLRQSETHKFRSSSLGDLPETWTVGGILDVAKAGRQPILTGPFGADLGSDDFVEEGVPVLRIGNVQAGYVDCSELLFVSDSKAAQLSRYQVCDGDLLFARQGATTGRNALADQSVAGFLINYHIIRVAVDHAKCVPIYLHAVFNSNVVKRQIEREKGRGTREGITTGQLAMLRFPIPPVDEQKRIAKILDLWTHQQREATSVLSKLQSLKSGLMRDLLTGKVSIEPLVELKQAATS